MDTLFAELFEHVKDVSKQQRIRDKEFRGQAFWQPIKQMTEPYDAFNTTLQWKHVKRSTSDAVMALPEWRGETESMIETNHFLIQLVRIPSTEPLSLRKILQIALNIGQYLGMNPRAHPKILEKYKRSRLADFITKETYQKLNALLHANPILVEAIRSYLFEVTDGAEDANMGKRGSKNRKE
jgi:hypothetical protein